MKDKIKSIIIDDEPDGRALLKLMVEQYCPGLSVLAICDSAMSGIQAIEEHKPDLVFLDIEMPGMNGFAMLESLGSVNFEVIFVTSYDQYAIKAFRVNALDYLLKPLDEKELVSAVDRCATQVQKNKTVPLISSVPNSAKRLVLPVRDGYFFVNVINIIRLEADGNYTQIFLQDGSKHVVAKTLKDFEQNLVEYQFIRVHKSHLINLNFVKRYIRGEGGIVVMSDNSEIEVSRRSKEAFLALFNL